MPSASSQPAILSLDFDPYTRYLYVMSNQNETHTAYRNLSEEVRLALKILGVEFHGYRYEYFAYQFIDTTLWRNWFVDLDNMHDRHIKSMMDSILEYRARSATRK